MTIALSPTTRRMLAVLILAAVLAVVWNLAVRPVAGLFADRSATIEQLEKRLISHRRLAAAAPQLRVALNQARADGARLNWLFEGSSTEIVGAQLQDRIRKVVGAAGGRLKSLELLSGKTDGSWRRVMVRVTLIADSIGFARIVHALESQAPFVFLDDVQLHARRQRNRRPRRMQVATKAELGNPGLQIRIDAYGYMRVAKP
jgi:hypothetical protein